MRKMMTALALAGGLAVSTASLASAASVPMVATAIAPTPLVHVQYYGGYRGGPRHHFWRHERWHRHHHWHDGRGYR